MLPDVSVLELLVHVPQPHAWAYGLRAHALQAHVLWAPLQTLAPQRSWLWALRVVPQPRRVAQANMARLVAARPALWPVAEQAGRPRAPMCCAQAPLPVASGQSPLAQPFAAPRSLVEDRLQLRAVPVAQRDLPSNILPEA